MLGSTKVYNVEKLDSYWKNININNSLLVCIMLLTDSINFSICPVSIEFVK